LLFSFCYLLLRQVIQLLALQVRSDDFKDLEILVLRHELRCFVVAPVGRRSGRLTGFS
jgi:hypothetical protein